MLLVRKLNKNWIFLIFFKPRRNLLFHPLCVEFLWTNAEYEFAACSQVITVVNSLFQKKHNRMPVFLAFLITFETNLLDFYIKFWKILSIPRQTQKESCFVFIFDANSWRNKQINVTQPRKCHGEKKNIIDIRSYIGHIVQSLNLYTTKLTETFYACYMSVMCLAMPIYV